MDTSEHLGNSKNEKRREEDPAQQANPKSTDFANGYELLLAVLLPCFSAIPCCRKRIPDTLEFLSKHKKRIHKIITLLLFIWALGGLWLQFLAFRMPDYKVGSTYEGGDSSEFAYGLWLDEQAIIFSPEDSVQIANPSTNQLDYMASGQCRTFAGCLYDGKIYPTDDEDDDRFHRFGGQGHPVMKWSMWVAIILLTAALIANEYIAYRNDDEDEVIARGLFQWSNTELAETLGVDHYSADDWEVIWSFMKFLILSFFNCALTLPTGTTMVNGCLEAGGFFQLRHLIFISYIFVISCGSFLFLLTLFVCNIKCFDRDLGFGRLSVDVSTRSLVGYDENDDTERHLSVVSITRDATNRAIKGNTKPCTCGCGKYIYVCCFTIGSYLQLVLGLLAFFGALVLLVTWLSGLMAIINGIIDDPLQNSGQLLFWWFDLFKYCSKRNVPNEELQTSPATSYSQKREPNHPENAGGSDMQNDEHISVAYLGTET